MPRSKDDTLKALQAVLDDLYTASVNGVRDQLDHYADTGHLHRPTTKAQITRDHIVDRLRAQFDGMDDTIRIKDENQTTYFHLMAEYRVLVKKADECGDVQLTKSQTSFDFQSNDRQLAFDKSVIPHITNLYLGYVPNEQEPRNPVVVLVCPSEDGYHWMHELEPPAAFIAGEIGATAADSAAVEEDLVRISATKKAIEE